jgi:pyruvate formate lyase activating enzyme
MVNILPYHNIAQKKYEKLGRIQDFVKFEEPDKKTQQRVLDIFDSYGIKAMIGG